MPAFLSQRLEKQGDNERRAFLAPTLSYVLGLLLIACATIASHVLLSNSLRGMDADAATINASGFQRTLAVKTLQLAGDLIVTKDPSDIAVMRGQLRASLLEMRGTHQGLVAALPDPAAANDAERALRAAYLDGDPSLDRKVRDYFAAIEGILAANPGAYGPSNSHYLALRAAHRAGLVNGLDRVVKAHEQTARDKVEVFERLEETLLLATLLLLFLEAAFIFRPLIQKLVTSNRHLAAHNRLMTELAVSDTLTKLPNRTGFGQRLGHLVDAQSGADRCAAVMMLDLDRFKAINDKHGHSAGDRVLVEVGNRISQQLRDVDTVARLGGDEFAVIVRKLESPADAALIAERIIEAVCQPIALREGEVSVGTSIGITIFPDTMGAPEELLKFADLALAEAKRSGKGCHRFYDPTMQDDVARKNAMADSLAQAFRNDELKVYLQPIVSLDTGAVEFAESLIRWDDGSPGPVAAGEFIEVIEEFHMAPRLERAVFGQLFGMMREWQRDGIAFPIVTLNLSGANLKQTDFCERIVAALDDYGLTPDMIALEVLESALIDRGSDVVSENVRRLSREGFRILLDDFGTGYASLTHLMKLPVHGIKIDKSFVQNAEREGPGEKIASAILGLAKGLNLDTIGEGVETETQLAYLMRNGCLYAQGFLFHAPVPLRTFDIYLRGEAFKTNPIAGLDSYRRTAT